jgi:hypothetical protein
MTSNEAQNVAIERSHHGKWGAALAQELAVRTARWFS